MECKKAREREIATMLREVEFVLEDIDARTKGVPVGRVG
jgi:hypothetical protein